MFQNYQKKISNFAVDRKFQFSKILDENQVASLRSKSILILFSLTFAQYFANISSYRGLIDMVLTALESLLKDFEG